MIDVQKVLDLQEKALESLDSLMSDPPKSLTTEEYNAANINLNCAFNLLHLDIGPDPGAFFGALREPDPDPEGAASG